jgi:hypothetical protein
MIAPDAAPNAAPDAATEPRLHDVEAGLIRLNQRLGQIIDAEPIDLATGAGQSLTDPLWLWGVLGGKEVGKTTLINALADAPIADPGQSYGEGTFRPTVYAHHDDAEPLRVRLAPLADLDIRLRTDAPDAMRGLVLIDLPDFDSLFIRHAEQVRRVAALLDGVLWITTPKKVGDLAALREVQNVLKARSNFLYVVNKMDWLLAQSDDDPARALDRMKTALDDQIRDVDPIAPIANGDRSFFISAKCRTADDILNEIQTSSDPDSARRLAPVADLLLDSFNALRRTLTTPPTSEIARANKTANLAYQSRVHAQRLQRHYQPARLLDRLNHAASPDAIREAVNRAFPPHYIETLHARAFNERKLHPEWSAEIFKARLKHWSMIGLVAWPVLAIAGAFARLRPSDNASPDLQSTDFFRIDGLSVHDRAEAARLALDARLSALAQKLKLRFPDPSTLAERFSAAATEILRAHRENLLDALTQPRPGLIGRSLRRLIPAFVLLWFPLIQPVADAALPILADGVDALNLTTAHALVRALSATSVLTGLCASLLILASIAAALYAAAARDAANALNRRSDAPNELSEPLTETIANLLDQPISERRAALADIAAQLEFFKPHSDSPPRSSSK